MATFLSMPLRAGGRVVGVPRAVQRGQERVRRDLVEHPAPGRGAGRGRHRQRPAVGLPAGLTDGHPARRARRNGASRVPRSTMGGGGCPRGVPATCPVLSRPRSPLPREQRTDPRCSARPRRPRQRTLGDRGRVRPRCAAALRRARGDPGGTSRAARPSSVLTSAASQPRPTATLTRSWATRRRSPSRSRSTGRRFRCLPRRLGLAFDADATSRSGRRQRTTRSRCSTRLVARAGDRTGGHRRRRGARRPTSPTSRPRWTSRRRTGRSVHRDHRSAGSSQCTGGPSTRTRPGRRCWRPICAGRPGSAPGQSWCSRRSGCRGQRGAEHLR